jgi:hypothetical protein
MFIQTLGGLHWCALEEIPLDNAAVPCGRTDLESGRGTYSARAVHSEEVRRYLVEGPRYGTLGRARGEEEYCSIRSGFCGL